MFRDLTNAINKLAAEIREDRLARGAESARLSAQLTALTAGVGTLSDATKDLASAVSDLVGTPGEPATVRWNIGTRVPEGS